MADVNDWNFGTDEEIGELKKLNSEVLESPDDFEAWEKLVRASESLEGGLNRNSSPQAISATRDIFDRFLAKFPLFFGYWKKYADLEFAIAGTEAADMVYERGVASITNSVDLWTNYCGFKVETSHDPELIRELFERAANSVGLDYLSHPFWDKYIEFEERVEAFDKIFAILERIIHIPMHQYARYFQRFRPLVQSRPLQELGNTDLPAEFQAALNLDDDSSKERISQEAEIELRNKIDNYYVEIFNQTQTETTKRWTFESEINRPYFHVTELDEPQLANWRKYLDFEEVEGDYQRIVFLYERCLVSAAYYDEFWLRYARWMLTQPNKDEEVRNIYIRASCIFAPISRPLVRLQYARFEEMSGRVDIAQAIHEAILMLLPNHIETIISWANLQRRQHGLDAAVEVYSTQSSSHDVDNQTKGAIIAEWARLLWRNKNSAEEARQLYQKNLHWYLDVQTFWDSYLKFEIEQPFAVDAEAKEHTRIKQVYDDIRHKTSMSKEVIGELSQVYMDYLLRRGGKGAAKEYMQIDREINGPISVQTAAKPRLDTTNGSAFKFS